MAQPSPVVAFIIGLAIILLASVLNAAGLNLTKLDHVSPQLSPCPLLTLPRSARVPFPGLRGGATACDRCGSWE